MEQFYINHWAVITCAILNLGLGALWYSPLLFYKTWMKENNFNEENFLNFNPTKIYTITLIISLVIPYNLAFFLGDDKTDAAWGTTAGFLTGFGFSTLIFTIVALFEQRSWKYIFINGGYITVYFTMIGFILGAWRS